MADQKLSTLKTPVPVKKQRVRHNYIDKKKFHAEMTKYRLAAMEAESNGAEKPMVNNYLGGCFYLLCEKLSHRPNFANYSFREEMVGDGIENCLAAVDNFNPNEQKQNPFGYFSLIAWRAFVRRIQKEQKANYVKHKLLQNSGYHDLTQSEAWDGPSVDVSANEVSNRIIETFEAKQAAKKKTTKPSGVERFMDDE